MTIIWIRENRTLIYKIHANSYRVYIYRAVNIVDSLVVPEVRSDFAAKFFKEIRGNYTADIFDHLVQGP